MGCTLFALGAGKDLQARSQTYSAWFAHHYFVCITDMFFYALDDMQTHTREFIALMRWPTFENYIENTDDNILQEPH
jgi:hypothetical protein